MNQNEWHFFAFSDYQELDAEIKMNGFSIKSSFFSLKLSNEILMKDFKPVVMEKSEFEYPDYWKLLAF